MQGSLAQVPWPAEAAAIDILKSAWQPLDQLRDPNVCEALGYWTRKRGERLMPLLSDFNPAEIRPLLPGILAIDVFGSPRKFRFSIIGEAHKRATGMNFTGMTTEALEQSSQTFREDVERLYNQICERKLPCAVAGDLAWVDRSYYRFESIHLPFSRHGEEVDRIILVASFEHVVPSA